MEDFKYAEITRRIIGNAMTVHRYLGGGNFNEVIFQRALIRELVESEIKAVSKKELPIFYKGEIIGKKRLDILVEDKVLVEIKAVSQFEKRHYNQLFKCFSN